MINKSVVVFDRGRMPMPFIYDGLLHNNIDAILVGEREGVTADTMFHWSMIPHNTTAQKHIIKNNKRKPENGKLNIYIENEYIRASKTRYFSISLKKCNNINSIIWDVNDKRLNDLFNVKCKDIGHKGEQILVIGHDFGQGADHTNISHLLGNRNVYINKPSLRFYGKLFQQIRAVTKRPIAFRPKKNEDGNGNHWRFIKRSWPIKDIRLIKDKHPIEQDLLQSYLAINITSRASIDAIIAGVPVISLSSYDAVNSISEHDLTKLETPKIYTEEERHNLLCKMSYLQWSLEEYSTGEPFKYLNLFGLGKKREECIPQQ